jgi:hypothetical protein
VESSDFILDTLDGQILFNHDIDPQAQVMAKQYTFDGVQIWDYAIEEDGKTYIGPEAKDNSAPESPTNLNMELDTERNRIVLRWSTSKTNGKMYYYRIDGAIDNNHYSKLSNVQIASIHEPLGDRGYTVERSYDGVKWQEIARIKGTVFYEYMVDKKAPEPITNFTGSFYLYPNASLAQVTLQWDRVPPDSDSSSALYRVRATNRVGAISAPSNVVGPAPFKVGLKELIIRRKEYDGTLPTFSGNDAYTVAKVNDLSLVKFTEDVADNKKYIYGIWTVDKAGNYSPITYTTVTIGDATPPSLPLNVVADQFHVSVG